MKSARLLLMFHVFMFHASDYERIRIMPQDALGLLECKGLVALIEGSDAMLKSANVEMMGWDKAGSGLVTAFVKGDVAAVKAAVDAGAETPGRVGQGISVHVIARPHDELGGMMPRKRRGAAGPA